MQKHSWKGAAGRVCTGEHLHSLGLLSSLQDASNLCTALCCFKETQLFEGNMDGKIKAH